MQSNVLLLTTEHITSNDKHIKTNSTTIGVAGGACTPRSEENIWATFAGESCKCTARQRAHPPPLKQSKSEIFEEIGEI